MAEPVTISGPSGEGSQTWVPVDACTLPTVEQPVRVAEFDALFSETLTRIEQTGIPGARFVMSGDMALAQRARSLADRETSCCSFYAFTVTATGPNSVVMEVTVPDDRGDALSALVRRAQEARDRNTAARTA